MTNNNNVLLIFPSLSGGRSFRPDRPPLGILTVAGPLLRQGMQVTVLDERAEPDFDSRLVEELRKQPLCVGISSMSGHHITSGLRVSRLVKDHCKAPVVWGGVHPSIAPESTAGHELVDIVVRDDGEETFPRLLECIDSGGNLENIDGIAFSRDEKVVLTPAAQPADINALPPVPFHLVDLNQYISRESWTDHPHILPVETSRGCPYSCYFCTESVRKKKWRALPPERVLEDIRHYIETYNQRHFTFVDDNLFGNVARGEALIRLLAEQDLGIRWYTNVRTDYLSRVPDAFIGQLYQAGCRCLTFGAESGSAPILKMINKKATAEHVRATSRKLRGSGIASHFVTILGFPHEGVEDIKQTFRLNIDILSGNKTAIMDTPRLIPTPGTKIAELCLGELRQNYRLEDWANIFNLTQATETPWLDAGAGRFIERHPYFLALCKRTNRNNQTDLMNLWWRFLLRLYRLSLAAGCSPELDLALAKAAKAWDASAGRIARRIRHILKG